MSLMTDSDVAAASELADESLLDRCAVPVVPTLVRAVLHAVLRIGMVSSIIRLSPLPMSCKGGHNHVVRHPDPIAFRQAVTSSKPDVFASRGNTVDSCQLLVISCFSKSTSPRETEFTSLVPVQLCVVILERPEIEKKIARL